MPIIIQNSTLKGFIKLYSTMIFHAGSQKSIFHIRMKEIPRRKKSHLHGVSFNTFIGHQYKDSIARKNRRGKLIALNG